ncbi:MAG: beta-ketoacyl-ACP synthase II [Puniceicoccales bacterium]|jgi:3-oxoacyl-[acyl-carrier-protein] synthase II|nr:beta-ketoacyl-ACP synthase II [Puniceicoccales bacterium]
MVVSPGVNENDKRVVITGIGLVTPVGIGVGEFWKNLIAGKSGITTVTSFNARDYPCRVAGEVKNFNPGEFVGSKVVRRNDLYALYAIVATKLAVSDANVNLDEIDRSRIGVIVGSGIGGISTISEQSKIFHEKGHRHISPFMIPALIANIASGIIAIELGLKGPNFGVLSACATGTHAIGEAFNLLKLGKADAIFAGGSEAAVTPLSFAGFCSMRAMSTSYNDTPETASRPFDATRDGFVMGNGAGVLLLETLEHALARGAKIYCEIIGYSASCDAYHITSPDPSGDGLVRCYEELFAETQIDPTEIQYINAHGTSTPYNDKFEVLAIKKFFGQHVNKLLVSSIKGATGHLLGATGAIEAAVCAKTIETGKIAPTINYAVPDPECALNCVPNKSIDANINYAISENMGFGGQNTTLMFKKFSP